MLKKVCSILAIVLSLLTFVTRQTLGQTPASQQLILVHYMPWFESKPELKFWGWHWTMNHFDPEIIQDNKRAIASNYYPSIGPYDSNDRDVLYYHAMLMKFAGIDGVIIDWYGLTDYRDYAILHRNTLSFIEVLSEVGLKFAICYEDQTVPILETAGKITQKTRVDHVAQELDWLDTNWFKHSNYVHWNGKPVLLSFGNQGLSNSEWLECFKIFQKPVSYFSEHERRSVAVGAFDWPVPKAGVDSIRSFAKNSKAWDTFIPIAYPRFHDIYEEAKLHESYGLIGDDNGETFAKTFNWAVKSKATIVQIATWNDWGEGTGIEPSLEYGFRDLEVIQKHKRSNNAKFAFTNFDLKLPLTWYQLKKCAAAESELEELELIRQRMIAFDLKTASDRLEQLKLIMKPALEAMPK